MNAVLASDVFFVFNGVPRVLFLVSEIDILRKRNRAKFGQIIKDFVKCGSSPHSGYKGTSLNFKEFHVDAQPSN
jgi:hypothetical protein